MSEDAERPTAFDAMGELGMTDAWLRLRCFEMALQAGARGWALDEIAQAIYFAVTSATPACR